MSWDEASRLREMPGNAVQPFHNSVGVKKIKDSTIFYEYR